MHVGPRPPRPHKCVTNKTEQREEEKHRLSCGRVAPQSRLAEFAVRPLRSRDHLSCEGNLGLPREGV